ncbi:MAG: hypothetical protein IPN94_20965 [Sphingobacteriales bacterium]|nr:hypothetical protein [Sphingobacteriales bacterium]
MKNTVLMLLLCAYCGVVQAQDYFIKTININETSSDNGLIFCQPRWLCSNVWLNGLCSTIGARYI